MKPKITGFDAERILQKGAKKETLDLQLIKEKKRRIREAESVQDLTAEEFFKLYWPYGTFGNLGS